jgi:hypothetical protein
MDKSFFLNLVCGWKFVETQMYVVLCFAAWLVECVSERVSKLLSEWVSERASEWVIEYINDSYVKKHKNRFVNVKINVLLKTQHLFLSAYTFAKIQFYWIQSTFFKARIHIPRLLMKINAHNPRSYFKYT